MPSSNERTPLLETTFSNARKKKISSLSITLGLSLFVVLVGSVLARLPFSVFTFHPVFMTLFLVLVTEGIARLQPTTTAEEKRVGLKYHALIQSTAYISSIVGFSFIFYNKIISKKAHFESLHAKLGLLVFIYLFIQVIFGITIGLMPNTFYKSTERAKSLWKYHRVFGYVLLVLVWVTAQLGIRADYIYNNMYSPSLIYLHWVSLILVSVGIISRTRTSKWGI